LLKSTFKTENKKYFGGFSALQRAEIAEIPTGAATARTAKAVSVLFNEPKLLKYKNSV